MYFSFISFALIITLIKSNIGSFWLIHSCHNPPLKGSQNRSLSQAGIWRQELKRSWRNGVYWLVQHGLLIQPRLTCPWTYIPTVGWAISNQSLIKKMINAPPNLTTSQPNTDIFSIKVSLFSEVCSSCFK